MGIRGSSNPALQCLHETLDIGVRSPFEATSRSTAGSPNNVPFSFQLGRRVGPLGQYAINSQGCADSVRVVTTASSKN